MLFNIEWIFDFLFVGIDVEVNVSLVVMFLIGVAIVIGGIHGYDVNHIIHFKYF